MKIKSIKVFHYSNYLATLLILLQLTACEKNNDNKPENKYLVDYQLVKTLSISSVESSFTLLSINYPEAMPLKSLVNYEVEVYKVNYKTHYKSEEIIVSGLICVPNAEESFPLISFQNGTNTLNTNAPSVNPNNPSFLLLEAFAGIGYILLIPDYIGFGASSQYVHPYYVIEPTTNAVVDLINATKEFLVTAPVKARQNNHNYLMGYSQGGWSTLCALKRLESGNDSISVDAASCGAGAYNLINTADYIASQQTYPSPLYLPYYIYSHQQFGTISDPLSLFFYEPYAAKIPGLFDGMHSHSQINSELNDTIGYLLKPEFIASLINMESEAGVYFNFKNDLIANSIDAWNTQSQIRFYHGNIDDNVPVSESQNIYQDFQNLDSQLKVEYIEMEGLNHDSGVIPWGIKTLLWFNVRENKN